MYPPVAASHRWAIPGTRMVKAGGCGWVSRRLGRDLPGFTEEFMLPHCWHTCGITTDATWPAQRMS